MARKSKKSATPLSSQQKYKNARSAFKYGSGDARKDQLLAKRSNSLSRRAALTPEGMKAGLSGASVRSGKNVKGKRIAAVAEITAKNPLSTANKMRGPKGRAKIETAVRENVKRSVKGTRDQRLLRAGKYQMARAERKGKGFLGKAGTALKYDAAILKSKMSRFDKATGKQKLKKRYKALGVIGAVGAYRAMKNRNKEEGR